MPNHLHAILLPVAAGGEVPAGAMVRAFRRASTVLVNRVRGTPGADLWDPVHHEHRVRDGDDLDRLRAWVEGNPANWDADRLNPGAGRRGRS